MRVLAADSLREALPVSTVRYMDDRETEQRGTEGAWWPLAAGLVRAIGGALLLHVLGSPNWAAAAWLILHLKFRVVYRRDPGCRARVLARRARRSRRKRTWRG